MTSPYNSDMNVEEVDLESAAETPAVNEAARREFDRPAAYPDAILSIPENRRKELISWLDKWLDSMISEHDRKKQQWVEEERAYRAQPEALTNGPYENSCNEVVPAIAMAVDPIQARLSTGIFKADPVFRLKPLRKSYVDQLRSLEKWIDYYQKYKLKLRQVLTPRLFEFAKHGTMVLKTIYDRDTKRVRTYDNAWQVIEKDVTTFAGPRVIGVPIQNFLFPAQYQYLQDCPIVAERIYVTEGDLLQQQYAKKLTNVDKIKTQTGQHVDTLNEEQQASANHHEGIAQQDHHIPDIFEVWCDYDLDGDGITESLAIIYHKPTQTFLQLRYNWYFHQRKPYTVIPYTVTSGSIYGLGIAEMMLPFQHQLTTWHRISTDNAYLANIRMFITKKESGIENRPKLYGGRIFRVDDPKSDFIPFAAADIYPSTTNQQMNLFGMAEKRTGISDYMTGRESPIIGSRATATSTLALIQEGTRRVEEVMENLRAGLSEVIQNCIAIWIQYGLDGLDDLVFEDDDIAEDVKSFFNKVSAENVAGALAIDLSATDAANNKTAQQQIQLAVIQVMMQYLEKLVQVAQLAYQAQMQAPELAAIYKEVISSARNMFMDLLQKYDVPNPDAYLPDLEKFLNGGLEAFGAAGIPGSTPGLAGVPAIPFRGPAAPGVSPTAPGIPGISPQALPIAR